MFLSIKKMKNGKYLFYNGPRRMPIDEVARRCPIEWVRNIDTGAAYFIENHIKSGLSNKTSH